MSEEQASSPPPPSPDAPQEAGGPTWLSLRPGRHADQLAVPVASRLQVEVDVACFVKGTVRPTSQPSAPRTRTSQLAVRELKHGTQPPAPAAPRMSKRRPTTLSYDPVLGRHAFARATAVQRWRWKHKRKVAGFTGGPHSALAPMLHTHQLRQRFLVHTPQEHPAAQTAGSSSHTHPRGAPSRSCTCAPRGPAEPGRPPPLQPTGRRRGRIRAQEGCSHGHWTALLDGRHTPRSAQGRGRLRLITWTNPQLLTRTFLAPTRSNPHLHRPSWPGGRGLTFLSASPSSGAHLPVCTALLGGHGLEDGGSPFAVQ